MKKVQILGYLFNPPGNLIGQYCGTNIPTVVKSTGKNLYIVYQSTDANNNFKATWMQMTSMNMNLYT